MWDSVCGKPCMKYSKPCYIHHLWPQTMACISQFLVLAAILAYCQPWKVSMPKSFSFKPKSSTLFKGSWREPAIKMEGYRFHIDQFKLNMDNFFDNYKFDGKNIRRVATKKVKSIAKKEVKEAVKDFLFSDINSDDRPKGSNFYSELILSLVMCVSLFWYVSNVICFLIIMVFPNFFSCNALHN